jgi:ribose/xylose/arabinose/galactoside ABC-type transport system permease subunit
MFDFTNIGKLFIVIGLFIVGIGFALLFSGKVPWLGRLPGDFLFQGKQSSFYFPLTTCLLISVVISFVMWLINRR